MPDPKTITAQALELPEPDRAKLARQLLDSFEGPLPAADDELSQGWHDEVSARRQAFREGRTQTCSWAEVRERMQQEFRGL